MSYYLQLLAAFNLSALGVDSPLLANIITTVLLVIIGTIGMWRGLGLLERLDKYAVSLNLGVIIALLSALLFDNLWLWHEGRWRSA